MTAGRELLERIEAERCFGWNNNRPDPCDCPVDTCRVADWVEAQPPAGRRLYTSLYFDGSGTFTGTWRRLRRALTVLYGRSVYRPVTALLLAAQEKFMARRFG